MVIISIRMTEKTLLKKYGQRIKQLRLEKGLSQQELAAVLDIEKSSLSRLEAGKKNSKLYTLYKVAKALEVPLSKLLDISE